MTTLRRALLVAMALGVLLATTAVVQADPIVAPVGTANGYSSVSSTQYNLVSFTLGGSYSNVAVAASLVSLFQGQTGTAYLMNQVGPGTTVLNQLAVTGFNFAVVGSSSTISYVNLFSGLSLGPGTYYLVLTSTNPNGGGISTGNGGITYSTAPGTTVGVRQFTNNGNLNAIYPPGSTWITSGLGGRFFTVTGTPTAVPEPATLLLLGAGLAGVAGKLRRRASSKNEEI